jgi:hypothetical protein
MEFEVGQEPKGLQALRHTMEMGKAIVNPHGVENPRLTAVL